MFRKILVPLDGSPLAEAILPEVGRLLRLEDSEVVFLRVAEVVAVDAYLAPLESALEEARGYLASVESGFAREGARVRSVVEAGRPADVILRRARQEGATLIALATHGRSGLTRLFLGSVAEAVLRHTPVPVLAVRALAVTAPGAGAPGPVRNILVPLDGSERAFAAVSLAVELGRAFKSRILLLHVLASQGKPDLASARRYLDKVAEGIEGQGLATLKRVEGGDPAQAILSACRFHEADLVVMGTHGRSGVKRLVAGSVTEAVLRHAPVPLLIVRSVQEEEERGVA